MPDGGSGCISNDMGKFGGTCCTDDGGGKTGCPTGYECRQMSNTGSLVCVIGDPTNHRSDALTRILPRYKLCNAVEIETVHGFVVSSSNGTVASLAYYSTHGPIEQIANVSSIEMVLIAMHGAVRNADDYFCAAKATIDLQSRFSDVLVIAPIFYSIDDDRSSSEFLYWDSQDTDGAWRFGADSMGPIQYSSLDALDDLVTTIQKKFPNLKQLTLAGHSSGGQIVQRWSLLTSAWTQNSGYNMHSVVANPSNYVYLTSERFIDGEWKIPRMCCSKCPDYNKWEWGMDDGGERDVPYRKRALRNVTAVLEQYASRQIIYLAGGADRCNVSGGASGWCYSHGLETTCMDELQGSNRLERNARYIASLRRLGIWTGHDRIVVPGVGHDHAMMFQSLEGLEAIYFGTSQTLLPTSIPYILRDALA